jgi:protein-tyrosine phosphatase
VPFARSWWVVPGRLLAGYYPGHTDPTTMRAQCDGLVTAGIGVVINLMEEPEMDLSGSLFEDYSIDARRERFPIVDFSIPDRATMGRIIDAIDHGIASGDGVYVHCWGGRGRTGTVIGCWLLEHGHATPDNVFDVIDALRSGAPDASHPAPENVEQRDFVRAWGAQGAASRQM